MCNAKVILFFDLSVLILISKIIHLKNENCFIKDSIWHIECYFSTKILVDFNYLVDWTEFIYRKKLM